MTIDAIRLFMAEFIMSESAVCIQRDVADLRLPEDLFAEAIELCSALTNSKQEILSEIDDFEKLLISPAIDEDSWVEATNLILQWLWGEVMKLDSLIKALAASTKCESDCKRASLVLARSTDKIVDAFNRSLTVAKRIAGEKILKLN